jgi:radical SAM superfamily enzyme
MKVNYKQILSRDWIYPPLEIFSPISKEDIFSMWEDYNNLKINNKLWLYIHIPFCKNICSFCHCNTFSYTEKKVEKYFDYLIDEIEQFSKILTNKKFDSIYFGWGTPSIFSEDKLEILFEKIFENFSFKKDFAFCIEVMPETLTKKKIDIFNKYWVTRITFWIQSLNQDVLKEVNRKQDIDFFEKIFFYSKSKIKYTNIDIVAWLPLETLESFKAWLEKVFSWKPDMIHIYRFVNDSNTIFTKQWKKYTEDMKKIREDMYQSAIKSLKENWFKKIKNDDFAKDENAKNISIVDRIESDSSNLWIWYSARSNIFWKLSYTTFSDDLDNFYYKWFKYWLEIEKNRYVLQNILAWLDFRKYKEIFGSSFIEDYKNNISLIQKNFWKNVFLYKENEITLNFEKIKNFEFALFFYWDSILCNLKNI